MSCNRLRYLASLPILACCHLSHWDWNAIMILVVYFPNNCTCHMYRWHNNNHYITISNTNMIVLCLGWLLEKLYISSWPPRYDMKFELKNRICNQQNALYLNLSLQSGGNIDALKNTAPKSHDIYKLGSYPLSMMHFFTKTPKLNFIKSLRLNKNGKH